MLDMPCKKCIVRVNCREMCEELDKYKPTPANIKLTGAFISSISVGIAFLSSFIESLLGIYLFAIILLAGLGIMYFGGRKENQLLNKLDDLAIYQTSAYKKFGIRMPMTRRTR